MTYDQILNEYITFLWRAFQYDMEVFSQPWIYWTFLIPALMYLGFFMFKWAIITVPFWMPVVIILKSIEGIFRKSK